MVPGAYRPERCNARVRSSRLYARKLAVGRPPHALRRRHGRRAAAPGVAPRDVLEAHPRNALQGERLAYAAHWFATGCVSAGVYPAAMYRSDSHRPSLIDNATRELAPPAPAESRV